MKVAVGPDDRVSIEAATLFAELAADMRRDICAAHSFHRVQKQPPRWYCPLCDAAADARYVRAFERGLIAAGAEPELFIADHGEWP